MRKSNKKKLHFSVNAENMVKLSNYGRISMSKPAANMSGCPAPVVNLRVKLKRDNESELATLCTLPDTGASIDCVDEKFVKKHKLEILPDTNQMIELVLAERKAIQVLGTTKLTIQAPGGMNDYNHTVVSSTLPSFSPQFDNTEKIEPPTLRLAI